MRWKEIFAAAQKINLQLGVLLVKVYKNVSIKMFDIQLLGATVMDDLLSMRPLVPFHLHVLH